MSEKLPIRDLPNALNALCAGDLSTQDAERVAQLLRSDAHARRFYICYMDLHAALQWQAIEHDLAVPSPLDDGEDAEGLDGEISTSQLLAEVIEQDRAAQAQHRKAEQTAQLKRDAERHEQMGLHQLRLAQQADTPRVRQYVIPKWLVYTAAAAIVVVSATVLWQFLPDRASAPTGLPTPQAQAPAPVVDQPLAVATLIDQDLTQWGGTFDPRITGKVVYNRPMHLVSGRATLRFNNEAQITIEGPCIFEPVSASEIRLVSGKLLGTCATQKSKGFVVRMPNAELIDLGTEFGVLVDDQQLSKVFVFAGEVKVMTASQSVSLRGGEAGRVDAQAKFTHRPEDAMAFLVPSPMGEDELGVPNYYISSVRSLEPVGYWRFEEDHSGQIANEMGSNYPATIVNNLQLLGISNNRVASLTDNYLHVKQPMAELTRGDYTIEFWMRSTRNAVSPLVGFFCGGKTWGGVIETGPQLRFLHRSPAGEHVETGNNVYSAGPPTPDQWHHIAAVRSGQDLLLYIDGEPMGSALAPNPLDRAPQLIIGGGNTADGLYSNKKAFVGQLDELAVYDRALTRAQVQHHYRLISGIAVGKQR